MIYFNIKSLVWLESPIMIINNYFYSHDYFFKKNILYNDASIVESIVLSDKNACIPPECTGFILYHWRGRRVINRPNSNSWVFQVVIQLKLYSSELHYSQHSLEKPYFTCGIKIMWCTALNFLLLICWWLSVQNTSMPKLKQSNKIFTTSKSKE